MLIEIDSLEKHINQSEVKQSLDMLNKFLRQSLPLDLLMIFYYAEGMHSLRILTLIDDHGVTLLDKMIPLSEAGLKQVQKAVIDKVAHRPPGKGDIARDLGTELGLTFETLCTLALSVETAPLNYVCLVLSVAAQEYKPKHIERFRNLSEILSKLIRRLFPRIEMGTMVSRLTIENRELRRKLGFMGSERIIGADSGLKAVMEQIELIAPLERPVLITGETGVGKEVVACETQRRSARAHKPFISINCGAIPETLMASELFGHEKGAFTGADIARQGYFEQADGGTIFLDEIGELSPSAQVKLLRVLQTMTLNRVGSSRPIRIDVRVIAATNRDIRSLINEKKFREDLWFRINVFSIEVPPLRNRREDIPLFAEYFAKRISSDMNISFLPQFAEGAMDQLMAYQWPGNVRELRNVIERTLILSKGRFMTFPNLLGAPGEGVAASHSADESKVMTLDELVIRHIQRCLALTNGRIGGDGGAAKLLGLNPSTLRGKMRKFGINITHLPISKNYLEK